MQTVQRQLHSKNLRTFSVKRGGLQETDLKEIIRRVQCMLAPLLLSSRAIAVSIALSQKDLKILADGDLMVGAVLSIVGNALQAMSDGGLLLLNATRVDFLDGNQCRYGACASLVIAGKGSNGWCDARKMGSGKDVELSAAHCIIKQHHGSMKVERVPGQSVTTTVYLPLASPDDASQNARGVTEVA